MKDAKVFIEDENGNSVAIGEVQEFMVTSDGANATFALFSKKKPKDIAQRWQEDYLKDLFVQGSDYNSPFLDPSWLSSQSYRKPSGRDPVPRFHRGQKVVGGAKFSTLTMTFLDTETEVVWFEGEPLADVIERVAQALRG